MTEFMLMALGALVLVTMLVMPWVAFIRVKHLEADVEELRQRLEHKLEQTLGQTLGQAPLKPTIAERPASMPAPVPKAEIKAEAAPIPEPVALVSTIQAPLEDVPEERPTPPPARSSIPESFTPDHARERNFELNFGAKLPVWIGGIALALAGYYLVRYSIEAGLLGPGMRTLLALLFGGGLIASAIKIGPSNARVGQALAGAGIAVLYFALFAATTLHHLIPRYLGFIGMSGVTALAMVMALRHGAPIAILGMVGGFLTPILIGSEDPNTPMLLSYLYVLFSGLFYVIRRNAWWGLLLLLAPFVLVWAAIVLMTAPAHEAIFVGFFMLAIGSTVVIGTRGLAAELQEQATGFTARNVSTILNTAILSVGAVMIGIATAKAGFGFMDRALLFVLAAASLGLSWFDHPRYRYAPALTLAVSLATLAAWSSADLWTFRYTVLTFALLYSALPLWLLGKKREPLFWALLSCISAALFYLFAYGRMGTELERITLWPLIEPRFWSSLALGIAAIAIEAARRLYAWTQENESLRQNLLATFSATATGFIATALAIELDHDFLSIAIALEMLALSWLAARLEVKALRSLTALAALGFGLLSVPQLTSLFDHILANAFSRNLFNNPFYAVSLRPVLHFALPGLCFLVASLFLRRRSDTRMVAAFEAVSVALLAIGGYDLLHQHFVAPDGVITFGERGVITNALMAFGLLVTALAVRFSRPTAQQAGLIVMGVGVFRIVWFDLGLNNPLWDSSQTPGLLGLLVTFGLPLLWQHGLSRLLVKLDNPRLSIWVARVSALLFFVLANFLLRYVYHSENLASGHTSNAELYSYSVLWLVLAIILLVEGTRRNIKGWRIAAIGLMFVTVGKVFLLDADELTGLWRVFSFLGLGLSLIGLSWFTTRFVLKDDTQRD